MRERFMPWGKYQGDELRSIPRRYLGYILKTCEWIDAHLRVDMRAAIYGDEYPMTLDEQVEALFATEENKPVIENDGLVSSSFAPDNEGGRNGI
jgi:hypothetical protein